MQTPFWVQKGGDSDTGAVPPFLTILGLGGGWPSPDLCHSYPPTTLNYSMEVDDLL